MTIYIFIYKPMHIVIVDHYLVIYVTAQDHSAHEVLSALAPAPGNGPHGFVLKRRLVEEGGIAPI